MKLFNGLLITLIFALLNTAAFAQKLEFTGYASFRAAMPIGDVYHKDNAALGDLTPTNSEKILSIYDGDELISFKNESVFGLQARQQISKKLDATLLLQASGTDQFNVEARWAYMGYQATGNTKIIVGRFALPVFHYSATKEIGYSYNYTRLPNSIYSEYDFEIVEGIRVTHTHRIAGFDLTLEGSYSNWNDEVFTEGLSTKLPTKLEGTKQFSMEIGQDWWRIFGGGFISKFSTSSTEFNNIVAGGLTLFGASPGILNQSQFKFADDTTYYASAGFSIDYRNIIIDAEHAQVKVSDSIYRQAIKSMFSAGYRIGKFTPTVVYEVYDQKDEEGIAASFSGTDKIAVSGFVTSFNAVNEYKATSIHLRYDVELGVALKASYTRYKRQMDSSGSQLATVGIDLIF